jgi:hypothetical protein
LLFSNPDSKTGAGYHIKADDSIAIKFELIDLKKETDDIYLTFDTEYLPTIVGINTQQSLVSTTGCVPKHVPISEKAMNVTSEKYTIQRDGKIIYASKSFDL